MGKVFRITGELANFLQQSVTWEAASCVAAQEFPRIL
jgi:hypothetical protein